MIGASIAGLYVFLLFILLRKPRKVSLADVLKATDFNNPEQCTTIFDRLLTASDGCMAYAGQSLCTACKKGLMGPLCEQPTIRGYCAARS